MILGAWTRGQARVPEVPLNSLLHHGGYAVVFLVLLLEAVGLPLPGETVMIAAAVYAAGTGRLSLLPLMAVACTATVVGSALGYAVGRRFGGGLLERYGSRIGFSADRRLLAHDLMERRGAWLVLVSRFVTVLRSVLGLLAGASAMDARTFMLCNVIGGAIWCGFYCTAAFELGHAIMRVAGPLGVVIGVIVMAGLIAAFLFVRRHEARLIAAAKARAG
jgi:membrane protein DedA with SNARE-associated domain